MYWLSFHVILACVRLIELFLSPPVFFKIGIVSLTPFVSYIIHDGISLVYYSYPLVDEFDFLLLLSDFSDDFLASSKRFWATLTKASIFLSLGSLVDRLI